MTADLTPLNAKKVAVKFDYFKIGGLVSNLLASIFFLSFFFKGQMSCIGRARCLITDFDAQQIPVKAPDRARGELEITYLDEELRY